MTRPRAEGSNFDMVVTSLVSEHPLTPTEDHQGDSLVSSGGALVPTPLRDGKSRYGSSAFFGTAPETCAPGTPSTDCFRALALGLSVGAGSTAFVAWVCARA